MTKVPYVDKEACIGCGLCVDTVPAVFRFDDEMKAEVFDPDGDTEEAIQAAIDACPVTCIMWMEKPAA